MRLYPALSNPAFRVLGLACCRRPCLFRWAWWCGRTWRITDRVGGRARPGQPREWPAHAASVSCGRCGGRPSSRRRAVLMWTHIIFLVTLGVTRAAAVCRVPGVRGTCCSFRYCRAPPCPSTCRPQAYIAESPGAPAPQRGSAQQRRRKFRSTGRTGSGGCAVGGAGHRDRAAFVSMALLYWRHWARCCGCRRVVTRARAEPCARGLAAGHN